MAEPFDPRKEEYLALRKEVEIAMTELGHLEERLVYAVAIAFVWLGTHSIETTPAVAKGIWLLPTFLPIFGALRSLTIWFHLKNISRYIQQVEAICFPDGPPADGWETFLERLRFHKGTKTKLWKRRISVTFAFWGTFVLVTASVGVLGFRAEENKRREPNLAVQATPIPVLRAGPTFCCRRAPSGAA